MGPGEDEPRIIAWGKGGEGFMTMMGGDGIDFPAPA